jgi:predicted dehydrogenase
LCDINPETLERNRERFGLKSSQCFQDYSDLVKQDLDIVFLGTPMPFHADQSIKALESGKHVLSEVTAATNIEDCRRIVQTAKRTGMKYMMAENLCYYHFVREWKKMIQQGKLGKIFYAEGEYVHEIRHLLRDPETGELKWRANRPPIHYCTHTLGALLIILDDYIVKATASGKGMNVMPGVGVGAIDMQMALFETKKGVTIKMLRSQVAPRQPCIHFFSFYGTKGWVESGRVMNDTTRGLLYIEGEDESAREIDWAFADPNVPKEARKGGHGTSEYYLIRDFIDAIDNDTEPPINAVRAADMTIPGLIAHEAAMKGNVWLDVPHFE